jgi:hypothetical protein
LAKFKAYDYRCEWKSNMVPVMAIQNGSTHFMFNTDRPSHRRPGKRARSRRHPTYAGGSGLALLITHEVASGQGLSFWNQAVGYSKWDHYRLASFFAHTFSETVALAIHGQDVGMMG